MVNYGSRTRPSALKLEEKLREIGYNGRAINFGYGMSRSAVNEPEAIRRASNKRIALDIMADEGVPVPQQYDANHAIAHFQYHGEGYNLVGRPDSHRRGLGFWLCRNERDVERAVTGTRRKASATHFMDYIEVEKEFRVHVVNGRSIKISEKVGGGVTNNHRNGAVCRYPDDFHHKKTLRRTAKQAVVALGLDFGAVDIVWANDQPYVLEVNTAPCLTDESSDTLDRYANAFKEAYGTDDGVGVCRDDMEDVSSDTVGCECDYCMGD